MTDIEFHVNQPDKLHYSCRLLRKAYRSGTPVVVSGDAALLQQLDNMLWQFSELEFLPHCRDNAPAATVSASPILLVEQAHTCPASGVLVNIGQALPNGFERFARLIEVASSDEDDRLAARARWKHYQTRGYPLKRHELPGQGGQVAQAG